MSHNPMDLQGLLQDSSALTFVFIMYFKHLLVTCVRKNSNKITIHYYYYYYSNYYSNDIPSVGDPETNNHIVTVTFSITC
jgi:hypothetical protein